MEDPLEIQEVLQRKGSVLDDEQVDDELQQQHQDSSKAKSKSESPSASSLPPLDEFELRHHEHKAEEVEDSASRAASTHKRKPSNSRQDQGPGQGHFHSQQQFQEHMQQQAKKYRESRGPQLRSATSFRTETSRAQQSTNQQSSTNDRAGQYGLVKRRKPSLSMYQTADELGLTQDDYRQLLTKAEEVHRILLAKKQRDEAAQEDSKEQRRRKHKHVRVFEHERYRLNTKSIPSDLKEEGNAKRCVEALQPKLAKELQNYMRQFALHSRNKSRSTSRAASPLMQRKEQGQRRYSLASVTSSAHSRSGSNRYFEDDGEEMGTINVEEGTVESHNTLHFQSLAQRDWRYRIWQLFTEGDKVAFIEKLFWWIFIFEQVSVRVAFHIAIARDQSGKQEENEWMHAVELVLSDVLFGDAYSTGMMLDRIISNDMYDADSGTIRETSNSRAVSENFLLSLIRQLNGKLVQEAHQKLRASFGTDRIPALALLLDELSSEYSTVFYDVMSIADSTSKTQHALKDHCHSYMRQLILSTVYAMFLRVYSESPSIQRGGALEQQNLPEKIAKVFDSLTSHWGLHGNPKRDNESLRKSVVAAERIVKQQSNSRSGKHRDGSVPQTPHKERGESQTENSRRNSLTRKESSSGDRYFSLGNARVSLSTLETVLDQTNVPDRMSMIFPSCETSITDTESLQTISTGVECLLESAVKVNNRKRERQEEIEKARQELAFQISEASVLQESEDKEIVNLSQLPESASDATEEDLVQLGLLSPREKEKRPTKHVKMTQQPPLDLISALLEEAKRAKDAKTEHDKGKDVEVVYSRSQAHLVYSPAIIQRLMTQCEQAPFRFASQDSAPLRIAYRYTTEEDKQENEQKRDQEESDLSQLLPNRPRTASEYAEMIETQMMKIVALDDHRRKEMSFGIRAFLTAVSSMLGSAEWDDKFKTIVVTERRNPSEVPSSDDTLPGNALPGEEKKEEGTETKCWSLADRIRTLRMSSREQEQDGTFLTGTRISEQTQSAPLLPHDAATRTQEDNPSETHIPKSWPNLATEEQQVDHLIRHQRQSNRSTSFLALSKQWESERMRRTQQFQESKSSLRSKLAEIKKSSQESLQDNEAQKLETMKDADKAHKLSMDLTYKRMEDFESIHRRRQKALPPFARSLEERKRNKQDAVKSMDGARVTAVNTDDSSSKANTASRLSERVMRFTTQDAISKQSTEERQRQKKAIALHKESVRREKRRSLAAQQLYHSHSAPSLAGVSDQSRGTYFGTSSKVRFHTKTSETGRIEYEPDKASYSDESGEDSYESDESLANNDLNWSKPLGQGQRGDYGKDSSYPTPDSTLQEQARRRKQQRQEEKEQRERRQRERHLKQLQLEAAAQESDTLTPQTTMDSKKVWERIKANKKQQSIRGLVSWTKQMDTVTRKTRNAKEMGMSLPDIVLLEKSVRERRLYEHQGKVRQAEAEATHKQFSSQKDASSSMHKKDMSGITPKALSQRTRNLGKLTKRLRDDAQALNVEASQLHELPPAAMYPDVTPADAII
eukprot:gb/GECG01011815.1/.p1 GENE.gb/GECG01011815.1/~~gb/GECG01011815.1/.p1  ORF type:complete len:1529 (+),score=280.89 gb/GECG01011815.1/:1-4587(+)